MGKETALELEVEALRTVLRPFVKEALRLGVSGLRPDNERIPVIVEIGDIRSATAFFD